MVLIFFFFWMLHLQKGFKIVKTSPRNLAYLRLKVVQEADLGLLQGFQPLTIITKRSILDVAATLDLPLSPNIEILQLQAKFTN